MNLELSNILTIAKTKKIVIVGTGASGKDYLVSKLVDKGLKNCLYYTTRPTRKNETHGTDYYFVSEKVFSEMSSKNMFLDIQNFNNWFYGLTLFNFTESDVVIMNPYTLSTIYEKYKDDIFVIYLDVDIETRKSRLLMRNDTDSVDRRIDADNKMFLDFSNYNIKIQNINF